MKNKLMFFYSIILFLLSALFCSSAFCLVLYVDNGVEVSGIGTSWSTALIDLSTALDIANNGDQIWIKHGTYEIENEIVIDKWVLIFGGFNGTEIRLEDRDWEQNITMFNSTANSGRLFYIRQNVIIDGIIIKNFKNEYNDGGAVYVYEATTEFKNIAFMNNEAIAGGAIYYHNAGTNLNNCKFIENSADIGGAIYSYIGGGQVKNCQFTKNSAYYEGGAYFKQYGSSIFFEECLFEDNSAERGGAVYEKDYSGGIYKNSQFISNLAKRNSNYTSDFIGGGAICTSGTTGFRVENCNFFENNSQGFGGGIYLNWTQNDTKIINSKFTSNSASNAGGALLLVGYFTEIEDCSFEENFTETEGSGGAIKVLDSANHILIYRSEFLSNYSSMGGAVQNDSEDSLKILSCLFKENWSFRGGALHYSPSIQFSIVENSIFYSNHSDEDGGAIYYDQSLFKLRHCTLNSNSSNQRGGAIFYSPVSNSIWSPEVVNSIFWRNYDSLASGTTRVNEIFVSSNSVWPIYLTNCIFDDELGQYLSGLNVINLNPRFQNVLSNRYLLHLEMDSPAIDACQDYMGGHIIEYPISPVPNLFEDYDKDNRIIGEKPDMGADEYYLRIRVDILPGICPNTYDKEYGNNLYIVILGRTLFDVHEIDLKSIKVTYKNKKVHRGIEFLDIEVLKLKLNSGYSDCSCTVEEDNLDDLPFKIDLKNLKFFTRNSLSNDIKFYIEGKLKDGTPFIGSDCLSFKNLEN